MKYGICNELFKGWTWEETVDCSAALGYKGIEIAPYTLGESPEKILHSERLQLRDSAGAKNLEIIGLHWLLVSPAGMSITAPGAGIRQRTSDYLKSLIVLCADLGGKLMVLGSPKQRSVPPGSTYGDAFKYAAECLLSVLPAAAENNVQILIEPLGKKETDFINTAREAIDFIKHVNHPNLNLHLDVKAMCGEEQPVPEIIEASGEYLKHIHVNDPNRLGPGFGEFDYRPLREPLENIGYDGYLSVEVFDFSPGAEAIAAKSMEYLKSIFGNPEG